LVVLKKDLYLYHQTITIKTKTMNTAKKQNTGYEAQIEYYKNLLIEAIEKLDNASVPHWSNELNYYIKLQLEYQAGLSR